MFEYKVLTATNAVHLQTGLNSLGMDGWELVGQSTVDNNTFGASIIVTLKREKQWEPQKKGEMSDQDYHQAAGEALYGQS